MSQQDNALKKLQQAQIATQNGRHLEAVTLYQEAMREDPELAKKGLGISLAHNLILSIDWKQVSKNLPPEINYLDSSGWLESLKQGKPVNKEGKPIPWYTYPAIEFIEDKLSQDFVVFEYGAGNSTLWLAERVRSVVSVESDPNWFNTIRSQMPQNVEINLIQDPETYAKKIEEYPEKYFDLIIVDGINRNQCAKQAISKLKYTGFIIFDNTDNWEYNEGNLSLLEAGFKQIDFYGLLPSYTYKNCTSIFYKDEAFLKQGVIPSGKRSDLGKSCFQITSPISADKKPSITVSKKRSDKPKSNPSQEQHNNQIEMANYQEKKIQNPVVLIIFNRPDTTEKVFQRIREAKPPKLFVIADGPRQDKSGEAQRCQAARRIIDRVDWDCQVFKNYSNINLGGRKRISSGLDWVFSRVEEAIVLEDDCLPDPSFFRFCEELLEKYRDDERIMFISGNNFQFGRKRTEYSYYFSRYPHCWGWATWRRAWQHYDDQMESWPNIRDLSLLNSILEEEQAVKRWSSLFESCYSEKMTTSWAYRFTFACWVQNGLTILPEINLVSNIGFSQDASHTNSLDSPLSNIKAEAMTFPLRHPPFVIRNVEADLFTEENIFGGGSPKNEKRKQSSYFEQALKHFNIEKNDQEALNSIKQLKAENNQAVDFNYAEAITLARVGHREEAVKLLNELLTAKPSHRKAQILLKEISNGLESPLNSVYSLLEKGKARLNENQTEEAFNLLSQAKALKQPTLGLDYARAVCFLKLNQVYAAKQALYEELRYFPNHREAQQLLDQIITQTPALTTQNRDSEFQELLQVISPYTMLSEARLYSLFCLTKRICQENIPGNLVECGVAGGGSAALMATVVKRYTKQPRWLYAFDSFEGMPEPTDQDRHRGITPDATGWGTGTCAAPEASLKEICTKLGVDSIVKPVKGDFRDTLPAMRDMVGMIAVLHADGDWYESTKAIFENLYDRVSDGGLIQVDDYGFWEGCRQAVTEFEQQRGVKFELQQIDDTGVWFVPPQKFSLNPYLDSQLITEFYQDDPVAYGIQSQMSRNERFQMYYGLRRLLPKSSLTPLRVIEIGSFAGSSLFLTGQALKRVTSQLEGYAIEPGSHPQFQKVLEHCQDWVTHLKLFSQDARPQLEQKFNQDNNYPQFIFVDGDHTYEGVKRDIINYYPLLAPGGIMMFHDYLPPLNPENSRAILFHHGGNEPGIRQACQELMEETYQCEIIDIPLLSPNDPTQSQAHLPIIPGVFSTIRAYRKPEN